ncbi:hypothetical protein OSTOST_18292, partial [Ostertagia ostertagi]
MMPFTVLSVCHGVHYSRILPENQGCGFRRMKYSQISILASVNIIAITEKLSHSLEIFWAFQLITVVVAFVALFCFMVAGSLRPSLPYSVEKESLLVDGENVEVAGQSAPKGKEVGSMSVAMKEIFFERDFIAIIATNFIHTA